MKKLIVEVLESKLQQVRDIVFRVRNDIHVNDKSVIDLNCLTLNLGRRMGHTEALKIFMRKYPIKTLVFSHNTSEALKLYEKEPITNTLRDCVSIKTLDDDFIKGKVLDYDVVVFDSCNLTDTRFRELVLELYTAINLYNNGKVFQTMFVRLGD